MAGSAGPTRGPTLCAFPDITPVPVPTPSPLPTHDPTLPTIGGDALAGNGLSVPPGAPALPATLTATSWLVADLDTGEVLAACGAHRFGAPASVQKLLLVETVLPKLNPADVTTITAEDLNFEPGSSAVGLILGGQYSVETLFLGLLLNSGNDAANTLARLGGGERGVAGTLADMNAEARRLGAWDTHAETPSGLDGPGQVTSAYDLALIFRACYAQADFRRYVSTKNAQMPPEPPRSQGYQIQNDNRLLFEYPGALGGKTGFTDIARHTYVGAAERDGRRLVVTVLGAEVRPLRGWQQAAELLDWGFALSRDASVGHLVEPGEADKTLRTPEPPAASQAAQSALRPTQPQRSTTMAMLGVGALAFAGMWLLGMRVARRRDIRHREWRAQPVEPPAAPDEVPAVPDDPAGAAAATRTVMGQPPPTGPSATVVGRPPTVMGQPPGAPPPAGPLATPDQAPPGT